MSRRSKYGNKKTTLYGITFDSKAEAARYPVLLDLLEQGAIRDLRRQPAYELQPSFKRDGRSVRAIAYRGDFEYVDTATGKTVVEDVKGVATREFKLKAKLFAYKYPDIELRVVKS